MTVRIADMTFSSKTRTSGRMPLGTDVPGYRAAASVLAGDDISRAVVKALATQPR